MNRKSKLVWHIVRSCITGKVVWIYHGHSMEGCRIAYWRACKKEIRRVRQWGQLMEERRKNIMHLLNHGDDSCSSSSLCERKDFTPEQRAAAREIVRISKQQPDPGLDFYEHIIEESKRRNERSARWRENRNRMVRYGQTHTKSEYKPKGRKKKTADSSDSAKNNK